MGDCRERLAELDADSIDCCVTSPPYWGLRDYGEDAQIGLEPSPAEYVAEMVGVFREVRRVLKPEGTLWLNLGDSYAGSWGNQGRKAERGTQRPINGDMLTPVHDGRHPTTGSNTGAIPKGSGLKPKDLIGIPWRVAFGLQDDGWWLRSDIIWAKRNPMPESVKDRPTRAHEYVFLMTKSARYAYNADAIAGDAATAPRQNESGSYSQDSGRNDGKTHMSGGFANPGARRNARDVWTFSAEPCPEAHFAVMPSKLAARCVAAGCPEGGTVIDPFAGAGTTGRVAVGMGRHFVGVELSAEYAEIARKRIRGVGGMFVQEVP